jgi:acetyl esterase/lipase
MKAKGNKAFGILQFARAGMLAALIVPGATFAQEPKPMPLWPGGVPDKAIVQKNPEWIQNRPVDPKATGLDRAVWFVSEPTLTVYPAKAKNGRSPAVVIFPGGGFVRLAIDKEGHNVARFLNTIGVTGIVVKYRTRTDTTSGRSAGGNREAETKAIYSDGMRAVRTVRFNAEKWGIDPNRIGVMGFSAGGNMATNLTLRYDQGQAGSSDPVEKVGSRPDFAALIYPGIPAGLDSLVNANTPPVFMVNANDDTTTPAENCLRMCQALRKASIPVELHVFTKGSHGFGLGLKGTGPAAWGGLLAVWLREMNLLNN